MRLARRTLIFNEPTSISNVSDQLERELMENDICMYLSSSCFISRYFRDKSFSVY